MHFDCIIIGGGLAGLTMTHCLGKLKLNIADIDKKESIVCHEQSEGSSAQKHPYNNAKALALSYPSVQFLEVQGIKLSDLKPEKIKNIHVSSQGDCGITTLAAEDVELDFLALVVNSQI